MVLQVCDYAERINRPGDFATLMQKNKDGMYQTLEQFEVHPSHCALASFFSPSFEELTIFIYMQLQNDVYMVFQKAISINSQETVPYKEVNIGR
jgi:hypothetical protein